MPVRFAALAPETRSHIKDELILRAHAYRLIDKYKYKLQPETGVGPALALCVMRVCVQTAMLKCNRPSL